MEKLEEREVEIELQQERRRYALLQAAVPILVSFMEEKSAEDDDLDYFELAVDDAMHLLAEIERREK